MNALKQWLLIACCLLAMGAQPAFSSTISLPGGLTYSMALQPAGQAEGSIAVLNKADQPTMVRAYQTDYLFFANGTNKYGKPGSTPRSNARWITFTPEQFVIPAHDTTVINYTVQVPDDPGLTGTYWSMLMVEAVPDSSPLVAPEKKNTVGITTVFRYGIQMVTEIGATGRRQIRFTDKQLITADDKRSLRLDIENNGECWLRPSVWAELYDQQGAFVGRLDAGRCRIYPGCSVRCAVDLSAIAPGNYQTLIVVDNGDENVFGARYDLGIK